MYGDPTKLRARLRQLIKQGDDLLAEIDSEESRYEDPGSGSSLMAFMGVVTFESGVGRRVQDWEGRIYRSLNKHLGQGAPQPDLTRRPRDKDQRDVRVLYQEERERVHRRQAELEDLLSRVPGRKLVTPPASGPDLGELRASRIIDEKVLDGYARRMSKFNTVLQCSEAIGASKELLEATYRGVLDLLGEPYTKKDDYTVLGKKARNALATHAGFAPSTKGTNSLKQLLSGLGTANQALAELRNEYGTGHGRPKHPDGLQVRHARLAVDLAVTEARYLALTVQDLNLLTG